MDSVRQDDLYLRAAEFGPALARLARACEVDTNQALNLLQDMYFAVWPLFYAPPQGGNLHRAAQRDEAEL